MEDLTGKRFGAYQIIYPFGQGGMATVYKAYQPSMDRFVAIKVFHCFRMLTPPNYGLVRVGGPKETSAKIWQIKSF